MSVKFASIAILAVMALSACKKDDAEANPEGASAPSGLLGNATAEATAKAKAAEARASLAQPDAAKPLATYTELESGNQIMFLYVAASKLPPDYTKLASAYSKEFRDTSDAFRQNDLLQAIKPQLEQKIAQASADPYGWMEVDDARLGAYDFQRKGFPVGEFEDGRYRYFNDAYDYKIGWANYSQLAFAPVADEAIARQLESMRTGYSNTPRLKIYFFAQSADLDNERVNALVTRVQITDKSGRVLAEYGPDGSVSVESKSEADQECLDPAACAAQAAAG
ncbi:DUF4852 domain-containing protein [Thermomonas mangrovi]|jgi:hypothetical protein|uniref:DUF4852 domain-containing protein n=1 Tax=Thermomonas mangrovi TaxID=2993316 RepID=UPI002307EDA3|nr:DUF4852 domain-containing protein [Thermomonas mangrovi]